MPQTLTLLLALFISVGTAAPQAKGSGGPPKAKGGGSIVSPYQKDDSGGSGLFKAGYQVADSSLPKHTIYAPKSPPPEPMPVVVWGEGEGPPLSFQMKHREANEALRRRMRLSRYCFCQSPNRDC
jgi:hypothetical protein